MGENRPMAKHAKMPGKSLMDYPAFPSLLQTNSRSCPVHELYLRHRPAVNFLSLLCLSVTFWFFIYHVFAAEITIVGEVNYSYQLMADGQIYEVANTAMGDDLVMNHIAEKVEVTGTVEEKGEMKIITVKSFKAVPD